MIPIDADLIAIAERLRRLPEEVAAKPRRAGAWSPKEIMGHLIDSACNNHRRFVLAQTRDDLVFDGYDQEAWVRLQAYAAARWSDLVELWLGYNRHLVRIIARIDAAALDRPRHKHSLDRTAWKAVDASTPVTLRYFIEDYFGHMQHHLRQIWECEAGASQRALPRR